MEIKKRYDWENPAVIKRNKEDGHVIAFSYDNALDAAERKESPYKVTLNGKWKSKKDTIGKIPPLSKETKRTATLSLFLMIMRSTPRKEKSHLTR